MRPSHWICGRFWLLIMSLLVPQCVESAHTITRGTRFTLTRDELLTLPEFVLLSLFPNGLFPEGHMGGYGSEQDPIQVDVSSMSHFANQKLSY